MAKKNKKVGGAAVANPLAVMKQMMVAQQQAAAAGTSGKPEKIKGTQIKQQKGGAFIRVVTSDGKEFPVTSTKAVYKHLKSIGQEVIKVNPNQLQGVKKKKKGPKVKTPKTPEQQEAHREKMLAKHQAAIVKEGRVMASNNLIPGEVMQRCGFFMWVKPDSPNSIPANLRTKLQAMNDEFKSKLKGNKQFLGGITENVVYCRMLDISGGQENLKVGNKCRFKLYTDNKGVGGCEVQAA